MVIVADAADFSTFRAFARLRRTAFPVAAALVLCLVWSAAGAANTKPVVNDGVVIVDPQ